MEVETEQQQALHDFVHCPICNNIYSDPKQLNCLHTFCQACVNRLTAQPVGGAGGVTLFTGTRSKNVTCPMCRAETPVGQIKNDFRANELVSKYLNPGSPPSEYPCSSCPTQPRDIEWECLTCDVLMCERCRISHGLIPATKDHHLISAQEVSKAAKERLTNAREQFLLAEVNLKNQLDKIDFSKEYLINQKLLVESQIDSGCRDIIRKLTEVVELRRTQLKAKISSVEVEKIKTIEEMKSGIFAGLRENHTAREKINELLEVTDDKKVAYESHHGQLECPQVDESHFDVTKMISFSSEDTNTAILQAVCANLPKLSVNEVELGNSDLKLRPINRGRLSMLPLINQARAQWILQHKIDIASKIQRLSYVDGNIWICVTVAHVIKVLPADTAIKHESLRFPVALVQTSIGTIVVACGENKGLVEVSKDGGFIRHIEQTGSFHDVTACANLMAAFNSSAGNVTVYEYSESNWNKKYEVKPEVNDSLNSILLHYGLLIVGSMKGSEQNRIAVYEKGKIFKSYPLSGDFVRVCCTDPNQRILVSHSTSLLILTAKDQVEQLSVSTPLFFPLDVIFTGESVMWVLQRTSHGSSLSQFIKN